MIYHDPIIDELYEVRKELLKQCHDDLHELARRQQQTPLPPGVVLVTIDEARARQRELDAEFEASFSVLPDVGSALSQAGVQKNG